MTEHVTRPDMCVCVPAQYYLCLHGIIKPLLLAMKQFVSMRPEWHIATYMLYTHVTGRPRQEAVVAIAKHRKHGPDMTDVNMV